MAKTTQTPTDNVLARRIHAGEQQAFTTLVRRYERSLVALIRHRLGTVDAVEDVLQETLVHAWVGLRARQPRDPRAWLYQVARNRCSDHLRARGRRETPTEDAALAVMVDRRGVADMRRRRVIDEVVGTFETLPEAERQALRSFYVDGFTIREIAARHRRPPGTIKRRLSQGRDRVRGLLGITDFKRNAQMNMDPGPAPFPAERPPIVIEPVASPAADVDMRELTWWFVVPELNHEVRWAEYQPTDGGSAWRLTRTNTMKAERRATIHDRGCIEIDVDEQWLAVDGAPHPPSTQRHTRVWGRLTDTEVQWLAVESLTADGHRRLYTCLDDGFEEDFGACPRRVEAGDYLAAQPGGGLARRPGTPEMFADGMFDVRVGESTHRCTRIVEMPTPATEQDVVIVAYVDETGKTVLFRRYGEQAVPAAAGPIGKLLPHADRLVIDGMTFVHCFDDIIAAAQGAAV